MARSNQPDHRGADDVDARREELGHLFDGLHRPRLALSGVDDAVRVQGDQRVDVVGGDDAGGFVQSAQFGCVAADLVGASGMYSDQFEIWSSDDRPQGMSPHVAGGELDDSAHQ